VNCNFAGSVKFCPFASRSPLLQKGFSFGTFDRSLALTWRYSATIFVAAVGVGDLRATVFNEIEENRAALEVQVGALCGFLIQRTITCAKSTQRNCVKNGKIFTSGRM
jgi:hypothetical protein